MKRKKKTGRKPLRPEKKKEWPTQFAHTDSSYESLEYLKRHSRFVKGESQAAVIRWALNHAAEEERSRKKKG
jgi:hypothetical protein